MAGGQLKLEAKTSRIKGSYADLKNSFKFEAVPRADAPSGVNATKPSHDVMMLTNDGELVPCGALWTHEAQNGENKGMRYFRFSVDDPSLGGTLWLTAFPIKGTDRKHSATDYEVVWRRDQRAA